MKLPPPPRKKKKIHQDQVSGFIQKLDYFFISNTLQDFAKRTCFCIFLQGQLFDKDV